MRKNAWNDPRILFWQTIYESISSKYPKKKPRPHSALREKSPDKSFLKSIGEQIRNFRKGKKITQKTLAKKMNASQQLISRIEKGRGNTSLLTLKKITDQLGGKIKIEIKTEENDRERSQSPKAIRMFLASPPKE